MGWHWYTHPCLNSSLNCMVRRMLCVLKGQCSFLGSHSPVLNISLWWFSLDIYIPCDILHAPLSCFVFVLAESVSHRKYCSCPAHCHAFLLCILALPAFCGTGFWVCQHLCESVWWELFLSRPGIHSACQHFTKAFMSWPIVKWHRAIFLTYHIADCEFYKHCFCAIASYYCCFSNTFTNEMWIM